METSAEVSPFIGRCRDWCGEATGQWPRLREFLERMADRLRIHESTCRVQGVVPEDPQSIAELAYWQGQWILGMGPTQICENTVAIARACRAFLFAGELCPQTLPPDAVRIFEALLDLNPRC